MHESRTYDQSTATLRVRTGVSGRSARLGHRLVLAPSDWHATVDIDDGLPTSVAVTVRAQSLDVISGEGGVTPLSAPERAVARGNAHKSLKVATHPTIEFATDSIESGAGGYRLRGQLTMCGTTRPCSFDLTANADGALAAAVPVRQTEFGIRRFSMMMGTLTVADEVTVEVLAIP